MKKICLLLGILLVSCAPKIKVVTYNVGSFSKFQDNSTTDAAAVIRALDADIVGLNEVDRNNTRHQTDQAADLAQALGGWEYAFTSAFPFAGGEYGNAVLSKKPLLSRQEVHLKQYDGYEPRCVTVVETEQYVFASVHLDVAKGKSNFLQARDLNDWFALHYTGYDKPVILAGDFNCTDDSASYAEIARLWERVSAADATYPSTEPVKCIDYIFYLKTARPVELVKSRVVRKVKGVDVTGVSDHLPVYTELKIGKKRPSYTFVQMSDTQIGFFDYNSGCMHSDSLFDACVKELNRIRPALVVITGDLVDDPREPNFSLQDSIYRANLAKIDPSIEVFDLPGNHDIQPYNAAKREEYIQQRGYSQFSVIREGCAFIGIDSDCIKDNVTDLEEAQWTWMEEQLKAAASCRHRFIFLHCPVIRHAIDEPEDYFNFPVDKRARYIALFKQYGVEAVFSGHTHMENYLVYDGIQFINAGPVGNALARGYPGFHIVNVTDDAVLSEYVATPLPEGISRWSF